jgi:arginyl-tRNA synthetase
MSIPNLIQHHCIESVKALYSTDIHPGDFQINQTRQEFEGDYTIVLFSLLKKLGKSPDALGKELGEDLTRRFAEVYTGFNVIKGFLNLSISDSYWTDFLWSHYRSVNFGRKTSGGRKIMVEYSSPNTNKPLHLGHLRNIFLGWSVAEILKANGHELVKSCVVNDRGIHICKSMLAWKHHGKGQTPESTGKKGDHFVGDYYVKFNDELKRETEALRNTGLSEEEAEKKSVLMQETRKMLQDWEAGDDKVMTLWKMMNGWVYEGFDETYRKIGADFDKVYYESNTYLLGREYVMEGLKKGIFTRREDGSVWVDLKDEGLDEKLLLRKDGTSVYITQDIGLAKKKYEDYGIDESIYVIGDEQNYHMKVLQLICKKLGLPYANDIYHLSYGMVELPSGKMKSREGTVVDADDIIAEMENVAKGKTEQLGKVVDFSHDELARLTEQIGLGALKFFLLRVDPKKKMIFDPTESIDFQGFTAPFIQFNHARIRSVLRKSELDENAIPEKHLLPAEKELILAMEQFPEIIAQAGKELNPSVIAIYVYNLAKRFSSFYAEFSIGNAETEQKKQLRLRLSVMCANIINNGMKLLGISVPERM